MKRALSFAFLCVVALVCGAATLQADPGEFPVGALTPLTGSGAPYGPGMLAAIRIAADEINAAGGIGGAAVKIYGEDTGTDPATAIAAAKRLIETHKVVAVLGTWSSGVTMSVAPLTTRAGIIEMNVSGAPAISEIGRETGLVFRTQASNTQFGVIFAQAAIHAGYKRAATMAFNNPSGRGNTEEFSRNFRALGGEVTGGVIYEGGRASYRRELEKVFATKPQVIILGSYMTDTMVILRDWRRLNKPPVGFIAGAWAVNRKLVNSVGAEICDGIWAVDTVANSSSPTYRRFTEKYKKVTGQDPQANPYAPKVYDQMILLALAATAADSADPQVFKTKIREVSGPPGKTVYGFENGSKLLRRGARINYDGAGGAIDFNADGDVSPTFGVYRVEKGELVLQRTSRPFQAPDGPTTGDP